MQKRCTWRLLVAFDERLAEIGETLRLQRTLPVAQFDGAVEEGDLVVQEVGNPPLPSLPTCGEAPAPQQSLT